MKKNLATTVSKRLKELGRISDEPGRLTRLFGSPAMKRANSLVGSWMRRAGMAVRQDAIGNLIGHYAAESSKSKTPGRESTVLFLGSHLDTVRDAGKYDGAMGVLVAIACVEQLHRSKTRLPFDIEVIGFADEEGVRYQSGFLGSKAFTGTLEQSELSRVDADGITLAEAIRRFGGDSQAVSAGWQDPRQILGYVEVHIEQGPVLEQKGMAVGVVRGIAGQTRARVVFRGQAGHAGTTPMNSRRDALCAAAEFILGVETIGRNWRDLVATVGELKAWPGASNVIPGEVALSVDVRHLLDAVRLRACRQLQSRARAIARARRVRLEWQAAGETASVWCDRRLTARLGEAVQQRQKETLSLHSGAGHDAVSLAAFGPVAMLFVRCKNGLSHHPDEFASPADIGMATEVLEDFVGRLAKPTSGLT